MSETESPQSVETIEPAQSSVPIDASNAIIDTVEKTLSDIITESFNCVIVMKTEINLTPEINSILKTILDKCPATFIDVEKIIIEIVKDHKIDSTDVPQLIVLVQKLYEIIYGLKHLKLDSNKRSEYTSTILKFIIELLVIYKKIKIEDDRQVEFLKTAGILIDSCVGLLSYPKSLKTKGCIKKIFG